MTYTQQFKVALGLAVTLAFTVSASANSNHIETPSSYIGSTPTLANVTHTSLSSGYARSENLPYQFNRGMHHFENGDYDSASRAFNRVLRDLPRDPLSNYYMGLSKQQQGNHKKAIKHLAYIHKLYQSSPQVYVALGRSLVADGQLQKAQNLLTDLDDLSAKCGETCSLSVEIDTAKRLLAHELRAN